MKKKVLSLCLVIALVAIAAISTTLAYFTDTDAAKNVFTVGNVKIDMIEQERVLDADGNYTSDLQNFTQNQQLRPYVDHGVSSRQNLLVNDYTIEIRDKVENYVDKIISVKNTGNSDAYVRTIIAIPAFPAASAGSVESGWAQSQEPLHWNGISDTDTTPNNGWIWGKDDANEWPADADMNKVANVTYNGRAYDVYVVTNVDVVPVGGATSPCFAGFYIDDDVNYGMFDGEEQYYISYYGKADKSTTKYEYALGDISSLEIYAFTQAVQADGFNDAWEAFDKSFNDVTADQVMSWIAELNA